MEQFDETRIRAHLEKVVHSNLFENSTILQNFLSYIVEETLTGRAENIKEYTIALDVLGRQESFDAQVDSSVRVHAARLRDKLELYYRQTGQTEPVRIRVPKGNYIPRFERNVPFEELNPETNGEVRDYATRMPTGPLVRVKPLRDLSEGETLGNLALGFSEEILNALSRFREILVQPDTGPDDTLPDPGKRAPDFLLQGTIRRAGDTLRVGIQLRNAVTEELLLSETYDAEFSAAGMIHVQEEVAGAIAVEIADPFGPLPHLPVPAEHAQPLASTSAYEAVLAAYAYFRSPSPDLSATIEKNLLQAVTDHPKYASAWATLAMYRYLHIHGHFDDRATAVAKMMREALTAVDLDPRNSLAHLVLGLAHHANGSFDEFRESGETALRLNPNHSMTLRLYGGPLAYSGEWDRGLALVRKSIAITNFPPGWYHLPLVFRKYLDGNFEAALQRIPRMRMDSYIYPSLFETMIYARQGRQEEAEDALARLRKFMPDAESRLRPFLSTLGLQKADLDNIFEALEIAGLSISSGSKDEALLLH